MANTYGVFVNTPLDSDIDLARWYRQFAPPGVVHGYPGAETDWGDRCSVTVDGTGQPVTGTGYLLIGGYWYRIPTPIRTPITANSASQTRWDRLVARADPSTQECSLAVLEGTPGAGAPPDAVKEPDGRWDVSLATWQVAPGASVVSPTGLQQAREFTNPSGAVPDLDGVRHTALSPGGLSWTSDSLLRVRDFDGTDRTLLDARYPTGWQPLSLRSGYRWLGSGANPQWRWERPGTVELRGTIERSNGQPIPDDTWLATVPAAARPTAIRRTAAASSQRAGGVTSRLEVRSTSGDPVNAGRIWFYRPADGSYQPFWVSLDNWRYDIT